MRGLLPHRLVTRLALVATLLLVTAPLVVASVDAQPAPSHVALASSSPEGMYAYYYLWWTTQHWQTSLSHTGLQIAATASSKARGSGNGQGIGSIQYNTVISLYFTYAL